jgi:hypothetical protein
MTLLSDAERIFDKALDLEGGDEILIPCIDRAEQDSLRVQLYRQRARFKEATGKTVEDVVGISRVDLEGKRFVKLYTKSGLAEHALLIKASGEISDLFEKGGQNETTEDTPGGKAA